MRYCHLVAVLIRSERCYIPKCSFLLFVQLMGVGPMTVNATAASIVTIVQSFYQASINHTLVIQRLIMTISNQFSVLMRHNITGTTSSKTFIWKAGD